MISAGLRVCVTLVFAGGEPPGNLFAHDRFDSIKAPSSGNYDCCLCRGMKFSEAEFMQ
jgi:hypothetical protein